MKPRIQLLMALLITPLCTLANTSSVFSPDVKAGDQSMEYRYSYIPDEAGSPSATAHRLHVQHALDDTWRLRVMGAYTRSGGGSVDFNYTRFELQHQYREDEQHGWDAAIRYEVQIADRSNRADRIRLGWTAKWDLDDNWQLRTNLMVGRQFSANAGSGLVLETRGQITRKIGSARLGVEMFNDLNRTTSFGSFDDQEHTIGPILKFDVGGFSVSASYLFGVSDSADDDNFRLHLIHDL